MESLNKITIKGVLGRKPNAALLGDQDRFDVMTVFGTATGYKEEVHEFADGKTSDYIRFMGNFAAVRTRDGEEFRSRTLILPGTAENALRSAFGEEGDVSAVGFAFQVFMKRTDASAGYEYGAEVLTEPEEEDPLTKMRKQLESGKLLTFSTKKKGETSEDILKDVESKGTKRSAAK